MGLPFFFVLPPSVRDGLRDWGFRLRGGRRRLGDRGERYAARYLRRRGMKIVGRQERAAGGELDLVAVEGRTVVFVEVKTRRLPGDERPEHPLEAITSAKQRRIIRAAMAYLQRHHLVDCAVRFDVVAVLWPLQERWWNRPEIIHVRGAFDLTDAGSITA